MIIGGEHTFSPWLFFKPSYSILDTLIKELQENYRINYTFGGYFSLLAIIDALKSDLKPDSIVLLPSYLCPTILIPFKNRNVRYEFYKVDQDLFIDIDHLNSLINEKVKAILFVDYFGASQMNRLEPTIHELRSKNIAIIQDMVQCIILEKDKMFGDFIFNSFRKFFPFEGSILLTKNEINIRFKKINQPKSILYKRTGQLLRHIHIHYGIIPSSMFLKLFHRANENYYSPDILKMSSTSMAMLKKYDINLIAGQLNYYYAQLLDKFAELVPGLLKNNDFIPLGFVIKIAERNKVRKMLFSENIYPPIHWVLSDEIDGTEFIDSKLLSTSIITIPLLNLNECSYNYLYDRLIQYIH